MISSSVRPGTAGRRSLLPVVMLVGWVAVFFDGLDTFVYGTALPGMLKDAEFALDPGFAGSIGSLSTFGMLLGALSAGTITGWVGRRWVVVACCSIFSLASGWCALAPDPAAFGAARFVAGLGLGGLLPIMLSLVSEFASGSRRNLSIGILMTGHHMGGIAASTVGLVLLEDSGWRSLFWVGVVPLVVAVPLAFWLMPESPAFLVSRGKLEKARDVAWRAGFERVPGEDGVFGAAARPAAGNGRWSALSDLFSQGRWALTLLFWVASFGGLLLVYGVSTWLPSLMENEGYNVSSSLMFQLVINIGGIAGMLIAGTTSDRLGPVRVSTTWFLATAGAIWALSIYLPIGITYAVVFLAGVFLFSGQTMVYAAVAHVFPTSSQATAISWTTGIGRFGAVFGPWLGGQLLAAGMGGWGFAAFSLSAVVSMAALIGVAAILALQGRRRDPAPHDAAPEFLSR